MHLSRLQLGEIEDIVYYLAEPPGFFDNDPQLPGTFFRRLPGYIPEGLGIALDQAQRGAQLMGNVSDQILAQLLYLGQLFTQVVDGPGQLTDFIRLGDSCPGGKIAGGHLLGRLVDFQNRAGKSAGQQERNQQGGPQQNNGYINELPLQDRDGFVHRGQGYA